MFGYNLGILNDVHSHYYDSKDISVPLPTCYAYVMVCNHSRSRKKKVMSYYPVLLNLLGKKALVIGGGKVAQRKIETLLEYGALINIVSKKLTQQLQEWVEEGKIQKIGDEFGDNHLEGAFLVIAATNDKSLNHLISEGARKRGILINAVDQPADCNFILPSIVKRGDLIIAISTSGKSPALAKKIRKELESQFDAGYETFLTLMGRLRKQILSIGLPQEENSRIFNEIVSSSILRAVIKDDWEQVESVLKKLLPEGVIVDDTIRKTV